MAVTNAAVDMTQSWPGDLPSAQQVVGAVENRTEGKVMVGTGAEADQGRLEVIVRAA